MSKLWWSVCVAVSAAPLMVHGAEPGELLWTFDPDYPNYRTDEWTDPAIAADGTIYVAHTPAKNSGSGMFYAIRADGSERWSKRFTFHATWESQTRGFGTPSVAPDGTIYFVCGRNLYAFDPEGEQKWTRSYSSSNPWNYAPFIYPPAVSEEGRVYLPVDDQGLFEINPDNGSTLWAFRSVEPHRYSFTREVSITLEGDVIMPAWDDHVYRITPDGELMFEFLGWSDTESPSDGFCVTLNAKGEVFATQEYLHDLQKPTIYPADGGRPRVFHQYEGVTAPPLIGLRGELYFADRSGNLRCLNGNGDYSLRWTLTGYADQSPVLAADGTLYAVTANTTDPEIHRISSAGSILQRITGKMPDPGATLPGYEYPSTPGTPLAKLALGSDGTLYAASRNGKVYAFAGESPLAPSDWPKLWGGYANAGRVTHLAPELISAPSDSVIISGEAQALTVEFAARPAATVQWYRNGQAIPGADSETLMVGADGVAEQGDYYAVLSNPKGELQTEPFSIDIRHRLSVAVSGAGEVSIDPPGPLYQEGAVVTITPDPVPGHAFERWEGSLSGEASPLTITVERSENLVARFVDITPPIVELDGSTEIITAEPTHELTGRIEDNVGVAALSLLANGEHVQAIALEPQGTFSVTAALAVGENLLTIRARDAQGLISDLPVRVEWQPLRYWRVDTKEDVGEARIIEARINLVSPGDVAGGNFTIAVDPTYLSFERFQRSRSLRRAAMTLAEDAGVMNFTFVTAGPALPAGEVFIGVAHYRVRSLPEARTETLDFTEVSSADIVGSPFEEVSGIVDAEVDLIPKKYLGDVNNNRRYDSGDAQHLQRLIGGLEEKRPWDDELNDLNGSGNLDIGDVIMVLRTTARLARQPEEPAPNGRSRNAPVDTAYAVGLPHARLVLDRQVVAAGDKVTARIVIENPGAQFGGVSFTLDYPAQALRLAGWDALGLGSLPPESAPSVWNVEPGGAGFVNQEGRASFAIGSAESWGSSEEGGIVAWLEFTATENIATRKAWSLRLSEVEISTERGLEVLPANTVSQLLIGTPTTWPQWRTDHFDAGQLADEAVSGAGADPDLDGRDNRTEYLLGSDPFAAEFGEILQPLLLRAADGQVLPAVQFGFDPSAINLSPVVAVSDALEQWRRGSADVVVISRELAAKGDRVVWTVIDPRPVGESRGRAFRLELEP